MNLRFSLLYIFFLLIAFQSSKAQNSKKELGTVIGNVLDGATQKAIPGATVAIIPYEDSTKAIYFLADKNGAFQFTQLAFVYYHLRITAVGFRTKQIDSIHLRAERYDFNLNDILLSNQSVELSEVVIYAEKPLIESKDGNITFNVGESALSNGSSATELLKQTPLVTTDPNGKILVRGKEPKILIDDKPVELNMQQLQDLLESMPGSTIEKIEVLTNPPPQFANEQGGIINIVTKKGRVGFGGRINLYGGTRGELGTSANFNYRKQGFAINLNAGAGFNRFENDGYSNRSNIYKDSTNQLNIINRSVNENIRPNFRLNMDYDINKRNIINLVAQYNQNSYNNEGFNRFTNINRFGNISRMSEREIETAGSNRNPNLTFTYTHKGRKPGEQLRLIAGVNAGWIENTRNFFQEFLNADFSPTGVDSSQRQITNTRNNGFNTNLAYDKMLSNKKTSISTGGAYNRSNSHVILNTDFLKKPENSFIKAPLLSNDFQFHQDVLNVRASAKHIFKPGFSISAGAALEQTNIYFELLQQNKTVFNRYFNFLPFANFNRSWPNKNNLTFSYRRTIRRPGINELNPAIDYSDPYNLRYGNTNLQPSLAHNFDVVTGKTKEKYFFNVGLGYNLVEDIFSQIRTLMPDGVTIVTWDNVSNRQEYELSSWSGLTFTKKLRANFSASYIYNQYGTFDKEVRKFRDGGSFTSNLNANYTPSDVWTFTGNFTFNRFANPQGTVRSNVNMNVGIQRKIFKKKFIITLNAVDPFTQQQNRTFTFGPNFNLESFSRTQTRNYRLTLSYTFNKTKVIKPDLLKKQK
ncbi:MAG: outer membrane beta-barrel protein [Chitinophagaceae bacterium]|jgi:outer membrane receptor protein involved in Fe transport